MSSTVQKGFPPVPEFEPDEGEHRRKLARKINSLNQGKANCTIDVALSTAATTTITDARIFQTSYLEWAPQSSAAADARAGIWCPSSTIVKGAATLNHAASSTARPYRLVIWG